MDWSIQEAARLAHTTSRTLRHYGELGLLRPSRIGSNGYRYYDERSLVRLQRILLLRELGLGLTAIGEVLERHRDESAALTTHLHGLRDEQRRLARQIHSVQHTINTLNGKEQLMAATMFDGFDHTAHREEVEQRWGREAYANSDSWWRALSTTEKAAFQQSMAQLAKDWQSAAGAGLAADSDAAQRLAARQFEWLRGIPGTPSGPDGGPSKQYFTGLAEMYPADERFAATYGGQAGAEFVRDAMLVYAACTL